MEVVALIRKNAKRYEKTDASGMKSSIIGSKPLSTTINVYETKLKIKNLQ